MVNVTINPRNSALLIQDMQNDIVKSNQAHSTHGRPPAYRELPEAVDQGAPVGDAGDLRAGLSPARPLGRSPSSSGSASQPPSARRSSRELPVQRWCRN
jgi:hypothetical protein